MDIVKFKDTTYSTEDLKNVLSALGIVAGDSLCVHSELFRFGIPLLPKEAFNQTICQTLLELIGENGSLLIPTFTYSFCKNEVFDVLHTPSLVGMLGQSFLSMPNVRRTHCPIFSFAVKSNAEFLQTSDEVLGKGCTFEKLLHHNGKIITFGNPYLGYTFVHYLETIANVSYRFDKTFSGILRDENGNESFKSVIYRVRYLNQKSELDYRKIAHFLIDLGVLKTAPFGGGALGVMECSKVTEVFLDLLAKGENIFLV
ncbi:MAG: AAC(3) family N-acetyltransferase [Lachnospiraceae bacterium]|nr:AAC(3) family N-acetyltransferase [Lachnospiraceae bacterium]